MAVQEPVLVVDADGVLITAVVGGDGEVTVRSDSPKLVDVVKQAAQAGTETEIIWGATPVKASFNTVEGVLAALLHAAPGRTRIMQAPESVLAKYADEDDIPGIIH